MSYDRYVAICHPLHYHLLMSPKKLYTAITLSWVVPFLYFTLNFIMTVLRTFCGRIIDRVYCTNFPVVKLSCSDTTVQSLVGLVLTFVITLSNILLISFSYGNILRVCLHASKESQIKAAKTCSPHILAVINYLLGCLFEIIQSRINMNHVPNKARIFMSLYFLIIPPMLNPLIYGFSIQAIRAKMFKLFSGKKKRTNHQWRLWLITLVTDLHWSW